MRHGSFRALMVAAAMLLGLALVAGRTLAAEIILYDHRDFDGQSITLNQSTPDLGNFDNETSSVRVISGAWVLYRNANYGETPSRPSLTLTPGDYPDLWDEGFLRNRLSSVRLLEDDVIQPTPIDCPAPYQAVGQGGQCVWTCGLGTRPGPGGECVCLSGLFETGTDNAGRRECGPAELGPPQTTQPTTRPTRPTGPVVLPWIHWVRLGGLDIDGRAYQTFDREVTLGANVSTSASLQGALLEYRAAEGPLVYNDANKLQILANAPWRTYRPQGAAQPVPITFRLSAAQPQTDGIVYFQVRARFAPASGPALWIESLPHVDTILFTPQGDSSRTILHQIPAVAAYDEARARGYTFRSSGENDTACEFSVSSGDMEMIAEDAPRNFHPPGWLRVPGSCNFALFGGRPLAPGWSLEAPRVERGRCAEAQVTVDTESGEGLDIQIWAIDFHFRPNLFTTCLLWRWTVSTIPIRGPAGRDWTEAFQ